MILSNVLLPGSREAKVVFILDGLLTSRPPVKREDEYVIDMKGTTLYPGFINSHDHLDFNSFPALGHGIYSNYREWGREIQQRDKAIIDEVTRIPKPLRVQWGIYKNILNGFTTVVNHGEKLEIPDPLIDVIQEHRILHSPCFEENWKQKLKNPFAWGTYVMHVGEGTDELAKEEINEVIRANVFGKSMVAVHGVMMEESQARKYKGVIWCPASNMFLLGKTADIRKIGWVTKVVFGTDSTLTAPWNGWEHFRIAKKESGISEEGMLNLLTDRPAALWKKEKLGVIAPGKQADLVAVEKNRFFENDPASILMVMKKGRPLLVDERLVPSGKVLENWLGHSTRIQVGDNFKRVKGDLRSLVNRIREFYPNAEIPFSIV